MENNINQKDIRGKFKARSGKTYIFLTNGNLLEQDTNGNFTQVDLGNKENIKRIKDDIGRGHTDIER